MLKHLDQREKGDRWALIDSLLPETVSRARQHVPFYAEQYRGLPPVRCRDDLTFLPTLDKALMIAAGARALASDRDTHFLGNTSGTTGNCLMVHGCHEEEEFAHDFFTAFAAANPSKTRALVFSLGSASHGAMRSIPVDCLSVSSCVLDDGTARNFHHYLLHAGNAMGHAGRSRVISAPLDQLLLFTGYAMRHGISLRDFGIELMTVTGDYVSDRLRSILQEQWNATLVERYSLSEIFGGGSQSAKSEGFDFDRYVVPEVVDRDAGNTGELVLTTLYPFVQRQPMIRYRTGDIFTAEGDRYVFRGRKGQCLRDQESNEFLLYGNDLYDLFDGYPAIAREERNLDLASQNLSTMGKPLVSGHCKRGAHEGQSVRLLVELTFDPSSHVNAVRALRDEIVHKVEALSRGRVTPSIDFTFGRNQARNAGFKKSGFFWQYE